mmetsp:Transcript_84488/g.236475  ORF Transcript_84488/g.236475 Transcript_84488/m.236475 type:complete len:311 (-) Transcript_84488:291-1223(-)
MAVVAQQGELDSESLPVKNTFIHFRGSRRVLRVCATDPDDPCLLRHTAARAEFAGQCERISSEGDAGSQPADEVPTGPDSAAVHTPELTPRSTRSSSCGSPGVDPFARYVVGTPPIGWSSGCFGAYCGGSATTGGGSVASTPPGVFHAPAWQTSGAALRSVAVGRPWLSTTGVTAAASDALRFSITLRLPEAGALGLLFADGACPEEGQALRVQSVLPEGAIEAWNRQCIECPARAVKIVVPDDLLVEANGASDAAGMRAACGKDVLLKLTFRRPRAAPPWMGLGVASASGKVCLRLHDALQQDLRLVDP